MYRLYTAEKGENGENPTLILRKTEQGSPFALRGGLLALGCFDGVHPGHRALLKKARSEADRLSVRLGVWSPVGAKKTGQLLPLKEKLAIFASLGVDFYIEEPFEEIKDLSPMEFVEGYLMDKYEARALAFGENFTFGKGGVGDADTLEAMSALFGRPAYIVPLEREGNKPISSQRVRACLQQGDLAGARRLLGRNYGFSATVQSGRGVGKGLGFPTANLPLPKDTPLKHGVYLLWVYLEEARYPALANVGVHPTFKEANEPLLEAYLLKTPENSDLYGRSLRVEFLDFLRPERAFYSPQELTAQIERDLAYARLAFACADGGQ